MFGVTEDPVRLGLVASLAQPSGNATGINFFVNEVVAKRLQLLHELVPKAVQIAVLVNPANPQTPKPHCVDVREAAPAMGLQIQVLNAGTIGEFDAAFATFAGKRPDALFVGGNAFFLDRRVQFATLTARERIPATYAQSDCVSTGGLMSYGTDLADTFHQVGVYTGQILKGAKPADLPGAAIDQIRVRPLICKRRARARHRGAAGAALDRRRGDRNEAARVQCILGAVGGRLCAAGRALRGHSRTGARGASAC